jgi:hypothetical protein
LLKTPTIHSKLGKILPGSLEIRSSVPKPVCGRFGKRQEWSDKAMSNDQSQSSNEIQMPRLKGFLDFGLGH